MRKYIVQRALEIAKENYGQGEIYGVTNQGPFIELIRGDDQTSPWCAALVCWCYEEACREIGLPPIFLRETCAINLYDSIWNAGAEVPHTPEPGDIIFWYRKKSDPTKGHVGIVDYFKDGRVYVIEGNHPPTPSFVKRYSYNYEELCQRDWVGGHLFKGLLRL